VPLCCGGGGIGNKTQFTLLWPWDAGGAARALVGQSSGPILNFVFWE
jgi:hypothetical protein